MDDIEDEFYRPRRSAAGRVVVTLVVIAATALAAWAAEKRYHVVEWVEAAAGHGASPPPVDPRIATLLGDGERALLAGDLDAAQTAIDKASVLAEGDPRVSLDLARVEGAKAEIPWLELRLLPPEATDRIRVAKADLAVYATAAVRAVSDTVAAKPDDPQALVAKIDALRLAGESDAARGYVVAVLGRASEPGVAYALAALEMTQSAPAWPSIVERLRVATGGEGSSARARAALVYALVKAGDRAGATAEMGKLDALARPYPLLADLRGLLAMAPVADPLATDTRDGGAAEGGVDAGKTVRVAGPAPASDEQPGDTTPAGPLVAANQAMSVHDFARAEQIYQGILASSPGDSQALSGLGDIARARGDRQGAIDAYKRAVSRNPSYLPALLGLADTQWFGGDKAAAASGYKNIQDHFPEGTYPEYVRSRASGTP